MPSSRYLEFFYYRHIARHIASLNVRNTFSPYVQNTFSLSQYSLLCPIYLSVNLCIFIYNSSTKIVFPNRFWSYPQGRQLEASKWFAFIMQDTISSDKQASYYIMVCRQQLNDPHEDERYKTNIFESSMRQIIIYFCI